MIYQYWMGTEDSLYDLQRLEAEIHELRKAAAGGEKSAFFFFDEPDESEDDTRLGSHLIEKVGNLAFIKVAGSLVNNHDSWHRYMAGRITSYQAIIGATKILADDPDVARIALRVSSPGGAVTGLSRASEAIRKLDKVKPVFSHVDNMAFSAGYWLSSSAREIIAGDPMAEFGSIGTLMVHTSKARMAEEMGIDITVFRAGDFKAMGHPMEKMTDMAQKYLQADIDKTNSFFLEHVSKRRNLSIAAKDVWGNGQTFFASEAQTVGLIDRVEDLDDLTVRLAGTPNHHNRSYGMLISPEKLARIEAGACPKDVLTAEELKQYEAAIAGEGKDAEEDGASKQAGGDVDTNEEESADESDDGKSASGKDFSADLTQLLKDNGRLEAKLEVKDETIADLKAKLASQEETLNSLMAIGLDFINGRQLALGKPKTSPSTSEGIISAYHELSVEMTERFKVGRQSKEEDPKRDEESYSDIPRNLQARKGAK